MTVGETAVIHHENPRLRVSLHRLRELLAILFPDPPSPDLFTLEDFLNRYRLTGLGKLAMAEIDRSQRMARAIGGHLQIGLCEFQIGLIFLYWGQFHGAWQQFAQARRQWSFVQFPAGVVLTQLASGFASMHQHKYEQAMVHLGKVHQGLERIPLTLPSTNFEQYLLLTSDYLLQAQSAVRAALQAPGEINEHVLEPGDPAPPILAGPDTLQLPTNNMSIDNSRRVPIPAHMLQNDDNYAWYKVLHRRSNDFMAAYDEGDWLLVYTDLEQELLQTPNQPVLILTDPELEGAIQIVPRHPLGGQRICLAQLHTPPSGLLQDVQTCVVRLSAVLQQVPIDLSRILGIVVGLWRPVQRGNRLTA